MTPPSLSDLTAAREVSGQVNAATFLFRAKMLATRGGSAFEAFMNDLPRYLRSAIPAHLTSPSDIADNLTQAYAQFVARMALLGRLGGMPVPAYVPTPFISTSGVAAFVAEAAPAPAVLLDRNLVTTQPGKLAILAVLANELVNSADPRSISTLQTLLTRLIIDGEDTALLSTAAAVTGGNPAGLLNGVTASGAGSPSALDDDVRAAWDAVSDGDPIRPRWITSPRGAMYLKSLADDSHGSLFANVRVVDGGDLVGAPLLISRAAGARLILVDAALIGVTDEGLRLDTSESAAVQSDSAPSAGGASLVSAFQNNSTVIRVTRFVAWQKATTDAIAYVDLPIGSPS